MTNPKRGLEWLANSTHDMVARRSNFVDDDLQGWVCIEGLKNRKKPVLKKLPGVPRVGDLLNYVRRTQAGHGRYVVVEVEWFTVDFAHDAMGWAVVRVQPLVKRRDGKTS